MAACSKIGVGGYQCELVGDVSEDYVCALCKHVAREPHSTSCCGETVCIACITPVLEDKKPCPFCEAKFTTWLNVKYQRRILALEVRCTMKDRGCEWTGKLEGLEAHLDVNTGDCEYVDVECPNKCDQPVEKRNLPTHLAKLCSKREFTCQYCNFKATYEIVSNDHWPQCSFYPEPCPNACGIQAIERGDLEAHLLQCPLEEVECDFSHAGCNTKLPRQDLERHVEESTQKHLVLMSTMSARISREFEQKLHKQRDEFQRYMEQKERETAEKDKHLKHQLEMTAQQTREQLQKREEQLEHKLQAIKAVEDQLKRADKETHRMVQRETEETKRGMKVLSQKTMQELAEKDAKIRKVQERTEEKNKAFERQLQAQQQQIKELEQQNQKLKKERDEQIRAAKQQFERKQQEIEGKLQITRGRQDRQIEMAEAKIRDLQQQLQQKAQRVEVLERGMGVLERCTGLDREFEMPNFKQHRDKKDEWYSPSLYTHLAGYSFCFRVSANGYVSDTGTHVTAGLCSVKDMLDSQLPWPAKYTITLELINQERDQDHITVTMKSVWTKPVGERNPMPRYWLIAHKDLEYNAQKLTCYLKNDSLLFRIPKVELN